MGSNIASEANYDEYTNELCGHCKKKCNMKCSNCKSVSYCSRICQKADWKVHQLLWKCSIKTKDDTVEENLTSPASPTIVLEEKNKIKYGEILNAQIMLTYTFLADDLVFGNNDDEIDTYLKMHSRNIKEAGFPLDVTYFCTELLDKPIFKDYEGAVYYNNSCFGTEDVLFDGHLPFQNPIKISEGADSKQLTPRKLIEQISNGVGITSNDEFSQYASNNLRPLFNCSEHKDLSGIQLFQFKDGVLILVTCF